MGQHGEHRVLVGSNNLKFSPCEHQGRVIGFEYHTDKLHVFFGCVGSEVEVFKQKWPYEFLRLKQVHGNKVVQAPEVLETNNLETSNLEADGHWTQQPGQAVCINTADCVPVMLVAPGYVCGVHAGWRGVEARIVETALTVASERGVELSQCQVFIGPHIGKDSFEVQSDVVAQLQEAMPKGSDVQAICKSSANKNRYLVDLLKVLRAQLAGKGVLDENIHECLLDTFADQQFHSYRRDAQAAGRQISFVALK